MDHLCLCREANEEYAKKLRDVGDKMFRSLSLGLGLEAHEMIEAAGSEDIVYMLKINYYPPCPRPDLALGVVAHTDMSYITLLVPNEVQGLQVFKDGHWYDVSYIPNAIIVHIGDQIEVYLLLRHSIILTAFRLVSTVGFSKIFNFAWNQTLV